MGSLIIRFHHSLQFSAITLTLIFGMAAFSQAGVPPINNECIDALQVFNGTTPFDTSQASNSPPVFDCANGGLNIWYVYTATCTGDVEFNTCGSSFDTVLEIVDSTNCNSLVPVLGCDDDADFGPCSGTLQSILVPTVVEGQDYIVRVGGFGSSSGTGVLNIIPQENCEESTQACVITIEKTALPPDDTVFEYFTNQGDFTLSDPSDATEGILLEQGDSITIQEEVPVGWQLNGVECEVTVPAVNISSIENGVELECVNGGQARCTFSNQIAARPIPTMSEWSMIAVAVLLGAAGLFYAYRKRKLVA